MKRGRYREAVRKTAIAPVYMYRRFLSPLTRPSCRFQPTCSEYFEQAVMKYGVLKGTARGLYRILRCNPFNEGGYDPP